MALTLTMLDNAAEDVEHIGDVATSQQPTATDRLGRTKRTLVGTLQLLLALNPRGPWASAAVYSMKDVVTNGGIVYVSLSNHTSGASFAADLAAGKWGIMQGVLLTDLGASDGSSLVTFTQDGVGAVDSTVEAELQAAVVRPEQFGAVGDDSTDDSAALVKAFSKGGTVLLTRGKTYYCNSQVMNLTQSVHIVGYGAVIRDCNIRAASSAVKDVTFEGVKFTTGLTSGNPPYAVRTRNVDFIRFKNCIFVDVMVYPGCDDGNVHYGIWAEGNRWECTWTNFNYTTAQLDCLTVAGYQGVFIRNNVFITHNINRVLKITAGLEAAAGNPVPATLVRGIDISGNYFLCSGTNCKQLADCYTGTVDFIFANNYVKASGHSRGVENKTGFSYTTTGIATSQKVVNNYFEIDCIPVFFQGAYGAVTYTQNSYDNLLVSGNTFNIETNADGTISVRFFNSVVVNGNQFRVKSAITSKYHMDISSVDKIVIDGNTVNGGACNISKATSNSNGETFNSLPKQIVFSNNVVQEYDVQAALCVKDVSAVDSISITGNVARTTQDNANITGAFWLRGVNAITNVTCTGNTAEHTANASKALLAVTDCAITNFVEAGNSWRPAPNTLANSATPSIKPVSVSPAKVSGGDMWKTGGTTAITNFTDGAVGQTIKILAKHAVTITDGASIVLNGGANFAMNSGDTLTLTQFESGVWTEVARSDNS